MRLKLVFATACLGLGLFGLTGCKNVREAHLKEGCRLAEESQKANSLNVAAQKLEEAVREFAAAEDAAGPLSLEAPEQTQKVIKNARADVVVLRSAIERRRHMYFLFSKREFTEASQVLSKLLERIPKRYKQVAMKDLAPVQQKIQGAASSLETWKGLSQKIEAAFRLRTEYRCWGEPSRCFPIEQTRTVLDGYAQGYDSPSKKVSPYKLGWVTAATDGSLERVRRAFGDLEAPEERARADFFVALLHERGGDFDAAAAIYRKVNARLLPDVPAALVSRRLETYDLLKQAADETQTALQMVHFVDAVRLTIDCLRFGPSERVAEIQKETDLFPKAGRSVADMVGERFRAWLAEDWARKYSDRIELVYRHQGVLYTIAARAPEERKALQPALKFTYYMLWQRNKKIVDLDDEQAATGFKWFGKFVAAINSKPDASPKDRAERFREIVSDAFGSDLPYFSLAQEGKWRAAIASLGRVKRHARQ